jgi:hypothetical protein
MRSARLRVQCGSHRGFSIGWVQSRQDSSAQAKAGRGKGVARLVLAWPGAAWLGRADHGTAGHGEGQRGPVMSVRRLKEGQ